MANSPVHLGVVLSLSILFLPTSLHDKRCPIHWTKLPLAASEKSDKVHPPCRSSLPCRSVRKKVPSLPGQVNPHGAGLRVCLQLCLFLSLPVSGVPLLSETFVLAMEIKQMILPFYSVCHVYSDVITTWKAALGTAEWPVAADTFRMLRFTEHQEQGCFYTGF